MSEDKKELNENELDKVNGGACNPDERDDDFKVDVRRASAYEHPCSDGACMGAGKCRDYDSCTLSIKKLGEQP